jgi:hypothetical protein
MDHPNFIEWANEPDKLGWRYAIVWRRYGTGIGWSRVDADGKVLNESQGAFYDTGDANDHPEGAIEWARSSANAHRARMAEFIAETETQ